MRSKLSAFHRCKLLFPLLCVFLAACTQTPPETIAGNFWAAALIGDQQGAAALALPDEFDMNDFNVASYHQLFHQARIGEAEIGSRQARVATLLEGHFESIHFDTVLVLGREGWLVDYGATTGEMIAALLDSAVSNVNTQIQEDIRLLGGSMGESIRMEWQDLDRQLKGD